MYKNTGTQKVHVYVGIAPIWKAVYMGPGVEPSGISRQMHILAKLV